jgi:hypothetical protein
VNSESKRRLLANNVPVFVEKARGCGYRKEGGLYFRGDPPNATCGKLPFELGICPTCGEGIPFSMAPKWVDPVKLTQGIKCDYSLRQCALCPLSDDVIGEIGKVLMIWVGKKFYASPDAFLTEARDMGISRRMKALPRGFEVGKHFILLAHQNAIPTDDPEAPKPGAFSLFRPRAIEYVCSGEETDDEIESLRKRGITPVMVEKADHTQQLPLGGKYESQ